MKKLLRTGLYSLTIISMAAFAHHPAADIVDDEIYAMIDEMVSDTPHADMTFDSMGSSTTDMTISTGSAASMQNLLEDGLLRYAASLNGAVSVSIDFNPDNSVDMRISQTE